jgi:predicted nucleic-acid-binding Zn-ribbon protein
MAACNACGTTILFGGTKIDEGRYCNARCANRGQLLSISRQIPASVVSDSVSKIFHGACPKCQGAGPVDVHASYRVWSAVVMTQWQSFQQISCRSCGVKKQLGDALFCLLLGWWGFPWGLIATPIQITRNLAGAMKNQSESGPSPKLENAVRIMLASSAVTQQSGAA